MKVTSYGFFLIGFVLIFGLASCKKDNEDQESKADILGTWVAVERVLSDCDDSGLNSTTDLECTDSECIRYHFFILKVPQEDTTKDSINVSTLVKEVTFDNLTTNESGTYSISSTDLSFCVEEEDENICTTSKFKVSETSLEITTSSGNSGCSEKLVFVREEE